MENGTRYLECFLAVADTLSFSKAAKDLRMSQPCVSRQVRLLEESLNTQLLFRDKHQVSLTREGEAFVLRVAPLFREIQQATHQMRAKSGKMEGTISIGSLAEIGKHIFSQSVLPFQDEHPGMEVRMRLLPEADVLMLVQSGKLDFGIVQQKIMTENMRCFKFIDEEIILVTRRENEKSLLRETSPEFVGYKENDLLLQRYFKFNEEMPKTKTKKGNYRVRLIVNSHFSMIEALRVRDAWAVLPRYAVREELANGTLKIVGKVLFSNPLHLICRDSHLREKRNEVFLKFLQKRVRG